MLSDTGLRRRTILQFMAAGCLLPRAWADSPPIPPSGLLETIQKGFALLDEKYWSPELNIWLDRPGDDIHAWYEGRLNPPWWSAANAVDTLADFMALGHSDRWLKPLEAMHKRHHDNQDLVPSVIPSLKARGLWSAQDAADYQRRPRRRFVTKRGFQEFNNEYLDDSGWWGLAWLKMHHLTHKEEYLVSAKAIHHHMDTHRLADGGIIWNLEQTPPVTNAITNGLFLTLSARLHSVTAEAPYLEAARRTRTWFDTNKLYDGTGIVDAPGHKGDYWSYNQGMWILGLLALAGAAHEPVLVDEAAAFTTTLLEKAGSTPSNPGRWDSISRPLKKRFPSNTINKTNRGTDSLPPASRWIPEFAASSSATTIPLKQFKIPDKK